jgi:sarcosine oxidase subunit delta
MLRIPCPFCGSTRDERVRPTAPQELTDQQWSDFLFTRDNTRGNSLERWRHTFGCRQWFGVERDTVSHAVLRLFTFAELPRRGATAKRIEGGVHEAA